MIAAQGSIGAPERDDPPAVSGEPSMLHRMVLYGVVLVLIVGLTLLHGVWAAQLLLVPLLLTVPGCLLLRALRVTGDKIAAFPLYVPATSLVVLMVSGLSVDLLGPFFGATAPLRPAPLLVGFQLTCLVLFLAGVKAPPDTAIPWRSLPSAGWLSAPLLLPLLGAAGALQLDHGRGPTVAVLAVIGCVLCLIFAAVRAERLSSARLAVLLFAVALAMMWSYALRSDLIYGYDIATEYAAAHQTTEAGIWHSGPHPDAYGAMLSITVLPAQLHALTGLTDVLVLKLVYPAIFAMFPVGIFNIAERFLPRRWAFVAAAFVLAQGGLSQQLPALARQEIALLLFAALCGAILEIGMPRFPKVALLCLFGPAIVVSHYSTAYFAITMLSGALVLQTVLWALRRTAPVRWTVAASLFAAVLAAVLWYVPITQSTSNVGELRNALTSDGLQFLPNASASKSLIAGYLSGTDVTRLPTYYYAKEVAPKYRPPKSSVIPAKDAGDLRYTLGDALSPAPAKVSPMLSGGLDLGLLVVQQLANLLGLIGAAMMAFQRRSSGLSRQIGLLTLPALACLMLFRVSGTFAAAYNQGRAQIQALTLVTIALCWLLHRAAPRIRRLKIRWPVRRLDRLVCAVSVAAVITIFVNASGLANIALGGGTAANLTDRGEDFERFYMFRPELAGARWLGTQIHGTNDFIYADRYGQLRLFAELPAVPRLQLDITPQTLNQRAWIYASHTNTVNRRARSLLANRLAIYEFPSGFINDHYDLVYTNGFSEVFHR